MAAVSVLTIHLAFPGCASLKEKRGRLKPLLIQLQRNFNISIAEIGDQDHWQRAIIACAVISNDSAHNHAVFQNVMNHIASKSYDFELLEYSIESF